MDAWVLERLGLTLNEKKTSVRNACRERFDFPGYTFGPHYSMRTGQEYIGYSPSAKSVARIKKKVGDLLVPGNVTPWAEVSERLNRKLECWRAYFGRGSTAKAYRAVDQYVYDTVRHFLRRRHQVSSQGTRQFPEERVFGPLGVVRQQGPMGAGMGNGADARRPLPRPSSTLPTLALQQGVSPVCSGADHRLSWSAHISPLEPARQSQNCKETLSTF